jgi:hypothetical protein
LGIPIIYHPGRRFPGLEGDMWNGAANLMRLRISQGWQPHSVRGFLSGTLGKKIGLKVESTKSEDGERVYSLAK